MVNEEKKNQPKERHIKAQDRAKVSQMHRNIRVIIAEKRPKVGGRARKRNTSHFPASRKRTVLSLRG